VSDLPSATGERPGRRPGCLSTLFFVTLYGIGFIDFLAAAGGSVDFVLEATAVALVAVIILGSARLMPAPQMILLGAGYLAFAIGVTGWEVLDGVAMIVTGVVAVAFGVASIGPRKTWVRARQLAKRATKALRR
jgi:hypothetical protein